MTAPDPTAHGLFALPRQAVSPGGREKIQEKKKPSRPGMAVVALVIGCTGRDSGARGKEHSSIDVRSVNGGWQVRALNVRAEAGSEHQAQAR
jgi:hypothetical protein